MSDETKYNVEVKNEKGEITIDAAQELVKKYPGIEHSPYLVMILDKIREDMSPARLQGLTGTSTPTNAAIKQKLNDLRKHEAYYDQGHPDYKRYSGKGTKGSGCDRQKACAKPGRQRQSGLPGKIRFPENVPQEEVIRVRF